MLSDCIIIATLVPYGKKDEDCYKIKYQSLDTDTDRTVSKSNNCAHLIYTLSEAYIYINKNTSTIFFLDKT